MERNVGRRKGILFTATSAVLFGITPVFSKQALLAGISSQMLALYSNGLACLTIGGCMKAKCISFRVKKRQLFHLLWIGCIGQAGTNLLLYRAYIHIPVGMATLIHFLYPLLVYGELILFFGERLEPGKLVGLFAAMAGLAVFLEKGGISGRGSPDRRNDAPCSVLGSPVCHGRQCFGKDSSSAGNRSGGGGTGGSIKPF